MPCPQSLFKLIKYAIDLLWIRWWLERVCHLSGYALMVFANLSMSREVSDIFPAGDSGYWEPSLCWSLADIETWLIMSVTRRPVRDMGCRSHHWPPRTSWSSCSCSSSGATPSCSPTGPGTGSSTQTGTNSQTCGGCFFHFEYLLSWTSFFHSRFLMDVIKSKPKNDEQTPSSSLNVLNQIDNSSFVDIDPNPPLCNARPVVV